MNTFQIRLMIDLEGQLKRSRQRVDLSRIPGIGEAVVANDGQTYRVTDVIHFSDCATNAFVAELYVSPT